MSYLDLTSPSPTTVGKLIERKRIYERATQKLKEEKIKRFIETKEKEQRERKEKLKGKILKGIKKSKEITSKFHSPVKLSGKGSKMTYKKDNPLKKLLSSKKRVTIRVRGY